MAVTVDPKVLATNLEARLKKKFQEPRYLVDVRVVSDGAEVEAGVKNCDTGLHYKKAFDVEGFDFDAIESVFQVALWSP